MGIWSIALKDNDTFADIYDQFYQRYNSGGQPDAISKEIMVENREILEIEEEKNSLWFALALAQWETKSLEKEVLSNVGHIISSGEDLKIWLDAGASAQDIQKRKVALDKFLEKIKSDRPKAKPRKRPKSKSPVFTTGDCLTFKLRNGNYGGAVVLATDNNPETAYNLVATTRLNQHTKPTPEDFENAEVLIRNFGHWQDQPDVSWYAPDLFYKEYSDVYEIIGKIAVDIAYDVKNYDGKGYLFQPSWTAGWIMNDIAQLQFESELEKSKSPKTLTIKQLTKKGSWWK